MPICRRLVEEMKSDLLVVFLSLIPIQLSPLGKDFL
jgi:hypothetical protein